MNILANVASFVVTGKYGVNGKLRFMQPMLNSRTLTADDLVNKESMDYAFLMAISTDIVSFKGYVSNE